MRIKFNDNIKRMEIRINGKEIESFRKLIDEVIGKISVENKGGENE